jgi:outer membrane protein assembly factor BamB
MTGNVSVLDLGTGTETGVISTGGIPEGVYISGDYLYVTDVVDFMGDWQPGQVYKYDLETLELTGTATVGINPQIVKMGPDGNLHVVCTGNWADITGQVDIVDPDDMTVEESIQLGGSPGSLAFTSEGIGYLGGGGWSGEGTVYSYNALTYEVIHDAQDPIVVPAPALGVAVTDDDNVLVCCFNSDDLVELDADGTLLRTLQVGDGPLAVGIQTP